MSVKTDWCNIPVRMPWKGNKHFNDLLAWLTKNLDERDWDWDIDHNPSKQFHRIYYFAFEKDATMFALRWT